MIIRPRVAILALVALGLSPCRTVAADLSFTGNLRFVTKTFLTVRLPDGRVIDARLPKTGPLAAESVAGQYKLADQVQIGCKNIRAELDLPFNRYHSLELTQVRFLRAPTPEEVLQVNVSLSWQGGDNLLKPPTVAAAPKPPTKAVPKEFEPVRVVNLANLAKLPSFIADEFAVRTRKPKGSTSWKDKDIIESEMSFKGDSVSREHVRINGKSWISLSAWLPGPNWGMGFGDDLRPLFGRDCENEVTFEGPRELTGKQVRSFAFRAPMDGCFGPGTINYQQYAGEHVGRIVVDSDGNVLQMEHREIGVPNGFDGGASRVLGLGEVKIGENVHLLPVSLDWTSTLWGDTWHVAVTYKNHRHFEGTASIQFK